MKINRTQLERHFQAGWTHNLESRSLEYHLHWILRPTLAVMGLGQGASLLMGNEQILPASLQPATIAAGTLVIFLSLLQLFSPRKILFHLFTLGGLLLALVQAQQGASCWEFLEKMPLIAVPFALLWLHQEPMKNLLEVIRTVPLMSKRRALFGEWFLRLAIACFLLGHGGLGVFLQKQNLLDQYARVGLLTQFKDAHLVNFILGTFEMVMGILALVRPQHWILIFMASWTFLSGSLYLTSGPQTGAWEFLMHFGAVTLPLALVLVRKINHRYSTLVFPDRTFEAGAKFAFTWDLVQALLWI